MDNVNINKILQYIALAIAIYLIFKYVPKQPVNNQDIIVITIIITLFCILLENIMEPYKKEQICSSVCPIKKPVEGMTSGQYNAKIIEGMTSLQEATQEAKQEAKQEVRQETQDELAAAAFKKKHTVKHSENVIDPAYAAILSAVDSSSKAPDAEIDTTYPPTIYKIPVSDNIERAQTRAVAGVVASDMPYNDYNHLPIPQTYVSASDDYGYSFLPPEKWYPEPPNPPICVSEKKCSVCPIYTQGTNVNLKDWYETRRVTPPDNINTKFVKEVLNSGR